MSSPSEPLETAASPVGVIHDIGYRPYSGPRLGERSIAWALFVTGLRHCFGLGRSARSKVLPMVLLGLMVVPAVILVGVLVQAKDLLGLDEHLVPYSTYPITVQLLISVFVAAQAPALISRDLRFRTITLYLARPASRRTYVLVRLASLAAATFLLIAIPLTVMYVGGLLADLPVGRETRLWLGSLAGALVLSVCLAGLAALVAALTTRRGLAVAAVIVVLLVTYTVVSTVQGIAVGNDHPTVAEVAGIFSPYTLVQGLQVLAYDAPQAAPVAPEGGGTAVLYVLAVLATVGGTTAAMLARYRRVS